MISRTATLGPARPNLTRSVGVTPLVEVNGISRENSALRHTLMVQQQLSALATNDIGIDVLVKRIAEVLDTTLIVIDDESRVMAVGGGPRISSDGLLTEQASLHDLTPVLHLVSASGEGVHVPSNAAGAPPILVAPVPVGTATIAFLVALDGPTPGDREDLALLLLEHAATVCGIVMGREQLASVASVHVRADLLEGLLSSRAGDPAELGRWAAHLGYDEQAPHRVVAILVGDDDTSHDVVRRVAGTVERYVTNHAPGSIASVRGREIVVVVPEPDAARHRTMQIGAACLDRIDKSFPGVTIRGGVGGSCRAAVEMARSYADARSAVEVLDRAGRTGVIVSIEELGIHQLLLRAGDHAHLHEFTRGVFGDLVAAPSAGSIESLQTLACYFRENNSPQRASRVLHVHPNTVAYRVRRVEELTHLDFHLYLDRLKAQMALEILDVVGYPSI